MLLLPYSRFTFTHHVQLIIEEVDSDVEVEAALDVMVAEVYDPSPLMQYICLEEAQLLKSKELLAQALEDCAHGEKEAKKGFVIGDYFTKIIG